MYKELIASYVADNSFIKLQESCLEIELIKAEEDMGYKFPRELKDLYIEINGDNWFIMSIEQMIKIAKLNREILSQAFDDIKEFNDKVGRFIFFATNGCGDYYGYRVLPNGNADTEAIYMWEHETFEHRIVAKDITDLICKYYNNEI